MGTTRRGVLAELLGKDLATEPNLAMVAAIDERNQNEDRSPLPRATIDRLRMQRTRGDTETTVPLPPSIQALLAYDAGLVLTWRPVFEMHDETLRSTDAMLASTTMTEVYGESEVAKGYADLTKEAEADMPALIELGIASDQRVFVYVAEEAKDADGEYPILRFDDEPCTWVSAGRLQDELLAWGGDLEKVAGAVARKEAAEKAVSHWLAREPEQRLVEDDDDDDEDEDEDDDEDDDDDDDDDDEK